MKEKILIVGGGTAGWITAAILIKGLDKDKFDVALIESQEIATVGVGEATIPPITLLLQYLELDEKLFLKKLNGTYKYGIHFENWSRLGESYMHAFGELGTPFGDISFTDMWLKCAEALNLKNIADFSPTSVAAYNGKFHPPLVRPANASANHFYPLTLLFYAYQFDASKLVELLKEYAVGLGVAHTEGKVKKINSKKNGFISSLTLVNGTKHQANYFVDCSGIRGLLNKQHYGTEFEDWGDYLPCDSAIAVQTSRDAPALPYTKSIAMSSGWRWQIPLRNRTGNGYVYSSKFISDEQAKEELMKALEGETFITEPKVIHYKTGVLKQPWTNNSISIGLSAGFMEPLESTSIHLIHKYAIELKNALVFGKDMDQEATDFNEKYYCEALSVRDFLVAHYHVTHRDDSAFWRCCQKMNIPETLANYLEEFRQTGKITLPENNLFPYHSWFQVLIGQRFLNSYANFADNSISAEQAQIFLDNVKQAIQSEINRIGSHQDYLAN